MSDSSDLRQRAKSAFQHAKQTVGVGDPPLATEVGGRVEAVREALRAFGEGDHERFLSALGDSVEWIAPRGEKFPGAGSCDGREAVKERFIGTVERSYTEFGFTPEHYLESPEENVVLVVGAFGGQGVKGPSQFDAPGVQIWRFDGDKVVGVQIFADSDGFPEAVQEDEPEPGEDDDDDSKEKQDSEDGAKGKSSERSEAADEERPQEQDADSAEASSKPKPSARSQEADGESAGETKSGHSADRSDEDSSADGGAQSDRHQETRSTS